MADWITPIYNRTQADVDYAIAELNKLKEQGYADVVYYRKGCLNANDFNRIEGDIEYLSDTLSTLYYFSNTVSKTWKYSGLPNVADVTRILDNIKNIISALGQSKSAPKLPTTMRTFEQINDIEKNLYFLKEMLDDMVSYFRECGTFTCGEEW